MPDSDGIEPDLVDELLALETREEQREFLRDAGLLNADGLDRLLNFADRSLNDDPGRARSLTEICTELADAADAPVAVPRAAYIRAGAHNLNGDFEADLRLTRIAHDEYVKLGMHLEALRTNIGKMGALLELGRYEEALGTGRSVLDALRNESDSDVRPDRQESDLLIALVHQNQAICYGDMGLYGRSLEALAIAGEHYMALGDLERLGQITDNKGVALRYLGRGSEALEAHEAAARVFEKASLSLSYATTLANIGETHLHLGNYTASLGAFENARRLASSLEAPVNEHVILLDTANAYLALNLYPEAVAAYREANALLQGSKMTYEHARGLWGMGSALTALSRLDEAEGVLTEAARLFAAVDNTPLLSGVMLEQASLQLARGDLPAALATAQRALELVCGGEWPVQEVYARLRVADLLLPDVTAVEPHLLAARRLAGPLALPHLHYRLNERLGHLRTLQGHDAEARVLLKAAVDGVERLRGAVAQDAMRASFLRDKVAAYENLLLLHLDQDREEDRRSAFSIAERAKSRSLVDLLTGVTKIEPAASTNPELGRRIQILQSDLNAIYGELLGSPVDDKQSPPLRELQTRAAELEQETSLLRAQAAAVATDLDPFEDPSPPEGILDRLPSDLVLLAYHIVGDEILAFVHARGCLNLVRGLGTPGGVGRLLHKLNAQWERFRAGQGFVGRHMTALERSTQQVLAALYDELFAPLVPLMENLGVPFEDDGPIPKLAVVPHGLLHQLPFHALFDGTRYLLERFEISYAPSASVFALCQERTPRGSYRALAFGVEDPSIPAAMIEAYAVAERFGDGEARVGERATLSALRDEAPRCDTLHLACHGLFRADNPMFSSLALHDGWLTAVDALSLDLSSALVTLSACESGRGEVVGGDEVLGLTRAFLGAGASTLVVSLWLVQDETTAELMGGWYEMLCGGERRAAALRAAQLELKERYPHPYFWAPFVLIGKR